MRLLAAGQATIGNPIANIAIFAVFVLITLYVVIRASQRNATATEFFTADRAFSGPQNGIAIRRRLSVGGQLPRHRRRNRHLRL